MEAAQTVKTALRHGNKDGYVAWLKAQGFSPEVSIALKSDVENLASGDRYYGALIPNSRVLLIETIGLKSPQSHAELKKGLKTTRYWQIMI